MITEERIKDIENLKFALKLMLQTGSATATSDLKNGLDRVYISTKKFCNVQEFGNVNKHVRWQLQTDAKEINERIGRLHTKKYGTHIEVMREYERIRYFVWKLINQIDEIVIMEKR